MGTFKYRLRDKLAFYASYFWYKLILPLEVRSPRISLWFYEWLYTAYKFKDYEFCLPWKSHIDIINTRFGSFKIRLDTADAANVSPAFERRDMNQLLKTIQQLTAQNKRVLFLDIGGDIGTYSIAVANRFPTEAVDIICFEPIPDSCALIRENIQRNQQGDRIELIEVALMDKAHDELKISLNTLAPGSSSITGTGQEIIVKGDTLDNLLLDRIHNYDAIVFKIDVEGAEKAVLTGAKQILATPTESILMIEDFIDTSIIPFLEQSGWNFQQKLTDYNSWWTQV